MLIVVTMLACLVGGAVFWGWLGGGLARGAVGVTAWESSFDAVARGLVLVVAIVTVSALAWIAMTAPHANLGLTIGLFVFVGPLLFVMLGTLAVAAIGGMTVTRGSELPDLPMPEHDHAGITVELVGFEGWCIVVPTVLWFVVPPLGLLGIGLAWLWGPAPLTVRIERGEVRWTVRGTDIRRPLYGLEVTEETSWDGTPRLRFESPGYEPVVMALGGTPAFDVGDLVQRLESAIRDADETRMPEPPEDLAALRSRHEAEGKPAHQ